MNKKEAPTIETAAGLAHPYLHTSHFRIERELSGVSTYVYRIDTGKEVFYLRILPEQGMSFGVEVQVHHLLRQQGVQVPEVIGYENRHETLGMSIMLVREIPGSQAGQGMSNEGYEHILGEAGKQIALVHRVPVDGFGWIIRGADEDSTVLRAEKSAIDEYLNEFLEGDLCFLSEQILRETEASRIQTVLKNSASLMKRHESKLVHGDFDDSHIFQLNERYTGMIDFGEIQGSSPLYDLGHFKLHDGQHYTGYQALAGGYGEIHPLTAEDQLEIDLWALWIGVRRLGIVGRRTTGSYLNHLTKMVRHELDLISSKL
ncbi:aminoglycoside phosphotransferase family protein [Paenibacillus dokdonensis]|uniref:aminoglycoside phosphotransferase family protein n=1 Tax=Paenibacillus dokdonensis TaxID=2567944 RepID=UPI0014579C53|nr:aminoglycoside phosphotransferase family protein [Paenibacillus dokdonensis]